MKLAEGYRVVFECIIGSTSYGTNTEHSDIDVKGVYIQPNEDILGLNYKEQVTVDKDTVYFELRRFISLLASANPSVLEMLFVDEKFITVCDPAFRILIDNRDKFLTKMCKNSFGGMALGQITQAKGVNKKMNWEKANMVRKNPIDFCTIYNKGRSVKLLDFLTENSIEPVHCGLAGIDNMKDCFNLYVSEEHSYKGIQNSNSNHVILSSIPKGERPLGLVLYNGDAYSQHCKKYKEYTEWLENRNIQRYVDVEGHNQKIDGKNLAHAIRLLQMAEEIANLKQLNVFRNNRQELLDIRHGKVDLPTIIEKATVMSDNIDSLFENSDLPTSVDREFQHELILSIRDAYWKSI